MNTYRSGRFLIITAVLIILIFFYVNNHVISYNADGAEGVEKPHILAADNYINQPEAGMAIRGRQENQKLDEGGEKPELEDIKDSELQQPVRQESQGSTPDSEEVTPLDEEKGDVHRKVSQRYVLGFYVDKEYGHPSSFSTMVARSSHISAIAPFWYRLSPDKGWELQEHHPYPGFTPEVVKGIISRARQEGIDVLMLVHNLLYSGQANGKELVRQLVASEETRKAFVDNVEGIIKEYGYDGINVDIENVYLDDRDRFSLLIKELYQRLAPQGYLVTVSVPAKTGDNRSNSWSGPFDYDKIGQYSHMVAIMTYDEHGYSSGPGPIASYGWVRDVMRYAVNHIPPQKILMGVPGYGFDWKVGERGPRYISYSQALNIASNYGESICWDDKAMVPYFKYRDKDRHAHQVWFESAHSLKYKLNIVEELDIRGIALWRLGLEDPAMWKVMEQRIRAEK